MHKMISILVFGLLLCFFIIQCNGTSVSQDDNQAVLLNNSETYEFRTGIGGDEEGASIKLQAQNYEISEIIRNAETNWEAVYRYKPKAGFTGTDYVELELSTGSDGASPPTKIEVIKINFQVN